MRNIHTHRSRKYRKIMHIEASTKITSNFAEAGNKTRKCKTREV
jgi:hypothetical protein